MPDSSVQTNIVNPEKYPGMGDTPRITRRVMQGPKSSTSDSSIQVDLSPFTSDEIQGSNILFENKTLDNQDVSTQVNLTITPNLDGFIVNLRITIEETSDKPVSVIAKDMEELCHALARRYSLLERVEDLHEQIQIYQRIINLPLLPQAGRWLIINNFSSALRCLSKHLGTVADVSALDACIEFQRKEVFSVLIRSGLPNQPLFLDGTSALYAMLHQACAILAGSLEHRYKYSGNIADLEEAVKHLRHSISLKVNSFYFFTLANLLNGLADCTHDINTRDEAILYYQRSLERPNANSRHHSILENLASALQSRFQETASPEDAVNALQTNLEALEVLSPGQPQRYYTFYRIASLYILPDTPFYDVSLSIRFTLSLAEDVHGSPRERLRLARLLLQELRPLVVFGSKETSGNLHASLMEIYGKTVRLLPQVAVFDLDIKSRLSALADSEALGTEAALLAIDLSQPELALELLEAGRAVFWSQARNLRIPFDALPPKLAEEFITLSRTLEKSGHLIAQMRSGVEPTDMLWDEALVTRRYQSDRFVELTERVRTVPGFEDFLLNRPYSHLTKAALKGPVVVLIPGAPVSYAILVKSSGACSHVQLKLPKGRLQKLGMSLMEHSLRRRQAGDDSEGINHEGRYIVRQTDDHSYELLEELWNGVTKPIIDALGLAVTEGRERPRVTWLPTGPFTFLPVHAAGVYHPSVRCCSNYMVSSYAPSIGTLLSAQQASNSTVLRRDIAKALLIAVSDTPGMARLPSTKKEIEAIAKIIPSESVLSISDDASSEVTKITTKIILQNFAEASIVHLACHGQQDALNPLESGFCVEDGRLTVAQLMEQNSQNASFAFLSACETAKGDSLQPDQSVHLAAAMLFAGFKSVVGTMWSMNDEDGPFVAEKVYSQLYKNEVLNLEEVPYTLDDAMRDLRERGLKPNRWALFIHMGI